MKKFNILLPSIAMTTAATLTPIMASCNHNLNKLTIYNMTKDTQDKLIGENNSDYWLTAEPKVSVSEKSKSLNRVGDVQELLGGGFNQAVLVCKKSLLTENPLYLSNIQTYLKTNKEYVANSDNTDTIKTWAGFPAVPAVNTQTLINCNGVYLDDQEADIQSYKDFISAAKKVNKDVELPNGDDFYQGFPSGITTEGKEKTIYYPSGAPVVGIANVIANKDRLCNTTTFTEVDPSLILNAVAANEPDLAILPSNQAITLYNQSLYEVTTIPKYVFLCTITWGNLYILSKNQSEILTSNNVKDLLINRTMGVLNLNAAPGLAFKILLNKYNIEYVKK